MFGAVIGDIIGSKFEFDRGPKSKEFKLFSRRDGFTDDTVMTVAVAEALLKAGKSGEKKFKTELIASMKKWGKKYPYAGYGGRFIRWVLSEDTKPYGSYGNGSAMRVSPVGWFFDSIERTRKVARWTAEVTHNHPEGIKGAESVAAVIFLARKGEKKEQIAEYVEREFGYDLKRTLEEIAPNYHHVEDCMHTVPEAIRCFLEGENYEDVIRNVMYIGGDTDTLGAIAGAMGEAFYGIPTDILEKGRKYLMQDIEQVLDTFYERIGKTPGEKAEFPALVELKERCDKAKKTHCDEDFYSVLAWLMVLMGEGEEAVTQVRDMSGELQRMAETALATGEETMTNTQPIRFRFDYVMNDEKTNWIPLFTGHEEVTPPGGGFQIAINMPVENIIREAARCDIVAGVVINPYTNPIALHKEVVKKLCELRDRT